MGTTPDITALLDDWSRGNSRALDQLLPLVYQELRGIARRQLRRERQGHTLQPTALVHEAYLRLVDQRQVDWRSRAHFFGVAAQVMRRSAIYSHFMNRRSTQSHSFERAQRKESHTNRTRPAIPGGLSGVSALEREGLFVRLRRGYRYTSSRLSLAPGNRLGDYEEVTASIGEGGTSSARSTRPSSYGGPSVACARTSC